MEKVVAMRKVLAGMTAVLLVLFLACGPLGVGQETQAGDISQSEASPEGEETRTPPDIVPKEEQQDEQPEETTDLPEDNPQTEQEDEVTDEPTEPEQDDEIIPEEDEPSLEGRRPAFLLEPEERLHAPLDVSEDIAKLLVTSAEYYDEDVVQGAIVPIDSNDDRYNYITGSPYKVYTMDFLPDWYSSEGTAAKQMSWVKLPIWQMGDKGSRKAATVSIQINSRLVDSLRCIFSDVFMLEEQFPVKYLAGFMYRKVGGSGLKYTNILSAHSFGVAVDINNGDYDNDMYLGKGNDLRDKTNPYCISEDVIDCFAAYGWNWGGNFEICADTMHFQYFGLDFLRYDSAEPFPILALGKESMSREVITNLNNRLAKLGYLKKASSEFDEKTDEAVKVFQQAVGIEPDGVVDYETWVPLINLTHDMTYVF